MADERIMAQHSSAMATCGQTTKRCDSPRVQLQVVFNKTDLASSAVVEQLNALPGLDVTSFLLNGVKPGDDGTIDIEKQFVILATVMLLIMGRHITSVRGRTRAEELPTAFQESVDKMTSHAEANP